MLTAPYIKRKIQCPAHYLVDPKEDVYLREPVERLKNVSDGVCKEYKIKKFSVKRDRFGNKMLDWKRIYALKKTGKVLQPFVTASFAIEHIFDPMSPVCIMCAGRCKRGKGKILETSIKRLSG